MLGDRQSIFHVPIPDNPEDGEREIEVYANKFINAISEKQQSLKCVFQSGNFISAYLDSYGSQDYTDKVKNIQFTISPPDFKPRLINSRSTSHISVNETFAPKLAEQLRQRLYFFNAERLNVGKSHLRTDPILAPNASNLAGVLHYLQSTNPSRFNKFNNYVSLVIPSVKQVTVVPVSSNEVQIYVWSIEPSTERKDLAIPLSESGTGIGQALAILYVVTNSDFPRTLIIDEPQSFLHPGAIRKLVGILNQEFPQHQYIIATHSPVVVASADPERIFLVKKIEAESYIEVINVNEANKLRLYLSEIGARLSDVFGADNILWVEGRTEEFCFPLLLTKIANLPLLGTEIIGVKQTGDFEGKHSKTTFEIYTRLSQGRSLLPPAIGFVFDQEGRTKKDQEDLVRQSRGKVRFLPRRMFENYLLNPQGIASIMSTIDGFGEKSVSAKQIEAWIEEHRWDDKYFKRKPRPENRSISYWLENVHGGKILEDLFLEFSGKKHYYDKIEHGLALTNWLIENAPEELQEIADLLEETIKQGQ